MPAFQPRYHRDLVWYNEQPVNNVGWGETGYGVRIDAIEGWDSGVDLRDVREPAVARDGEYADQLYAGGRTITISGVVHGTSWENLQERKRDLAQLFKVESTERVLKVPDPSAGVETTFPWYVRDSLGVAGYWRLNERSGTVAQDLSGNARPGTYAGTVTLAQAGGMSLNDVDYMALIGDDNTRARFATDGRVEIAYAAALNPAGGLVSAIVNRTTVGAAQTIVDCIAANKGFRLEFTAANKLQASIGTGAAVSTITGTTDFTATDETVHVGVWLQSGGPRLYRNGALEAGPSVITYAQNTTSALHIGRQVGGTNPFTGHIQDVIVDDSAYTSVTAESTMLQMWRLASGYYGTSDYTGGVERATARVLDHIVFGEMIGTSSQTFTVTLRASDPRIYNDTATTVSGSPAAISASGRRYPTPLTISATLVPAQFYGEVASIKHVDSDGNSSSINLLKDLLDTGGTDTITIRTPQREADWQTTYHNGRLKLFDPVAYWRLNETAGATADNAEGTATYDGAYTNTPLLNQSGHSASIVAVDFNGTDEYVTVPFNAALNPTTMSVELWVLFDTVAAGTDGIMGSWRTGATGWHLERIADKVKLTWYNGSATGELYFTDVFTSVTWYHLGIVFGPSSAAIYRDGVRDAALSYAGAGCTFSPVTTTSALEIGRRTNGGGSAYLEGKMDNVVLWDRVVTADEWTDLYAARTATPTFTNRGYAIIEAAGTDWFAAEDGTITAYGGPSSLSVSYRAARL